MKTKLKKGIEIFFTYLSILFITFPFFLNLDRRIISFFLFFFRFDSFRSLLYRILVLEEYFVHFFIDNRNYILILFILYLFNDHLHFNFLHLILLYYIAIKSLFGEQKGIRPSHSVFRLRLIDTYTNTMEGTRLFRFVFGKRLRLTDTYTIPIYTTSRL